MKIEVNKYSLNPRWFVAGTKGSYENETLEFVFSKEWDGLTKKVNFIPYDGEEVSIVYTKPITIPYEVMVRAGTCVFGVSGYKGSLRLLSVTGEMKVVDTVASPDNSTYVPTPDEMTQVMSMAYQALEASEQAVSVTNQNVSEVEQMTESVEAMLSDISTLKETTESQYDVMMQHYENSRSDYLEIVEMKEDIDSNASVVENAKESVSVDRDCVESVRDQIIELNEEAVSVKEETVSAKEETVSAKEEAVAAKEETLAALEKTKAECRNIFSNAVKGKEQGYAIRIDDALPYEQNLNITVLGSSSQSETPSRDTPSDISTLSESNLKIFSKNMITTPFQAGQATINGVQFTPSDDGGVVMNGTIGPNVYNCYIFHNILDRPFTVLRKGVTYRLTCFNGNNITLRICGESFATVLATSLTEHSKTITPDKDITIHRVLGYFASSKEGVELIDEKIYPMLEIVSDSEGFEAGTVKSVQIPLALCGIEDCADELTVNGNEGVVSFAKRYEAYSFLGEEAWIVDANDEGTTLAHIDVSTPISQSYTELKYQLCNRLPIKDVTSEYEEGIFVSPTLNADGTSRIYARLALDFAGSADFNSAFVSGDALIYPTNETKIDYSDTEWGKALLEMKAYPNTFTLDCDSEMKIDYIKDINKEIEKIYRAVISLGATL